MTARECRTCGFPGLRPEGHAEWCQRVAAWCHAHVQGDEGRAAWRAQREAGVR